MKIYRNFLPQVALGEPVSVRVRVPFTPENVLEKFEHAVKKTKL